MLGMLVTMLYTQVHGHWSSWTVIPGMCSVTCGTGTGPSTRTCTNPAPSNGGMSCSGLEEDVVPCDSGVVCPGKIILTLEKYLLLALILQLMADGAFGWIFLVQ